MWQPRKEALVFGTVDMGETSNSKPQKMVSKMPAQVFNILKGAEIQAPMPTVRCAAQKTAKPT